MRELLARPFHLLIVWIVGGTLLERSSLLHTRTAVNTRTQTSTGSKLTLFVEELIQGLDMVKLVAKSQCSIAIV